MSITTLPEPVLRRILSMLASDARDGLVLAYPELAGMEQSVPRVWLDSFNHTQVVLKSQARLQVFLGLGPYTDATLQNHVCRWCGRVFRKLMGNQFHAADDHPVEFQRLGTLQSNLLHHH